MRSGIGNALASLTTARREVLMGWDDGVDPNGSSETARHLMTALMNIELVIMDLEHEQNSGEPSEVREMASALAATGRPQ